MDVPTIQNANSQLGYKYFHIPPKIKRPAHLSIVERLGGFWRYEGAAFFDSPTILAKFLRKNSHYLEVSLYLKKYLITKFIID